MCDNKQEIPEDILDCPSTPELVASLSSSDDEEPDLPIITTARNELNRLLLCNSLESDRTWCPDFVKKMIGVTQDKDGKEIWPKANTPIFIYFPKVTNQCFTVEVFEELYSSYVFYQEEFLSLLPACVNLPFTSMNDIMLPHWLACLLSALVAELFKDDIDCRLDFAAMLCDEDTAPETFDGTFLSLMVTDGLGIISRRGFDIDNVPAYTPFNPRTRGHDININYNKEGEEVLENFFVKYFMDWHEMTTDMDEHARWSAKFGCFPLDLETRRALLKRECTCINSSTYPVPPPCTIEPTDFITFAVPFTTLQEFYYIFCEEEHIYGKDNINFIPCGQSLKDNDKFLGKSIRRLKLLKKIVEHHGYSWLTREDLGIDLNTFLVSGDILYPIIPGEDGTSHTQWAKEYTIQAALGHRVVTDKLYPAKFHLLMEELHTRRFKASKRAPLTTTESLQDFEDEAAEKIIIN